MKLRHLSKILPFIMLLFCTAVMAQVRTVSGVVTDNNGLPLPGAAVKVKETGNGTIADSSGRFELSIPQNARTLVVSSVGMTEREVEISSTPMTINLLESSSSTMSDLVVVAYGRQRKEDLTGAVTAISAKDFQKGNIASSEQLIQGKVPGLQITSGGGAAGGGSKIRIRGGASLNASNDPLIVIDGVPVESNGISGTDNLLSTINPNDIESMSVLKDASATALYGSRASNGVIIITTKRGTSGKPRWNFNTTNSISTLSKKVDVLTADQIREVVNANAAATGDTRYSSLLGSANTDWQDQIYQNAFGTDNNLSVSGTVNTWLPYRASVGYNNQDGILKTNNFNRLSGALSLTPKFLDDHLAVTFNLKLSQTKNVFADAGAVGAAVTFDPTQEVMDASNPYGGYWQWIASDGNPINTNGGSIAPNPLDLLMLRDNRSTVNRLIGNVQLDYKLHFLPDLHFIVNVGMDKTAGKGNDNISNLSVTNWHTGGRKTPYRQEKLNTLADVSLFYEKTVGQHKIDVLALHSFQDFVTDVYNYPAYSFSGDTIIAGTNPAFATDKPQYAIESYLGRINYAFNNKYLVTASIRRDAVSRFAPDNRVGYFPALALAWKLDEEFFSNMRDVVNELKLRFGWGITGQQAIGGLYDYMPFYSRSSETAQYQLGNQYYTFLRPGSYDATRKWETSRKINVALDYGFFQNRISGSIDVYQNKTEDLLSYIPIAPGSNFDIGLTTNIGNMENKGFEFIINTVPIRQQNFSWDLGFNFSYNKTIITRLSERNDPNDRGIDVSGITGGTGNTIGKHAVDYAPFSYYVYKQVYDPQTDLPIEGLYEDMNRDGSIDNLDRIYFKKPMPDFLLGFNTQVNYKKLSVGLTGHGMIGNYLYNNWASAQGAMRNLRDPLLVVRNVATDYLTTRFANNQYFSNYYIENASFFRLDNINVAYNIGRILNEKVNMRVSGSVQNVFVITKYSGLDPENSNDSGIDNTIYPRPRVFSIGLNLDF